MPADSSGVSVQPNLAVYRRRFLPKSETFIRDHVLHMPRYATTVLTSEIEDGIHVDSRPVVLAKPRTLAERTIGRIARRSPQVVESKRLLAGLRKIGPSVVHAHFGTDAAWLLPAVAQTNLPFVVTFHGYDATMTEEALLMDQAGRTLLKLFAPLVDRADAVVTVSQFLRSRLIDKGVPASKIHVIACGVGAMKAAAVTPAPKSGYLLFVGRLVEKKGLEHLLEALSGLPEAPELVVAGDGPLRTYLTGRATTLRVRARFIGMQSSERVADLMEGASLVVVPSVTAANGDSEGLCVTALEAGVHGRAIVGFAHGGLTEAVIDGRTGLLAEEGDTRGLRARLQTLLNDHELRLAYGLAGRVHVEDFFDRHVLLSRLADLYDEVREGRQALGRH